MKAKTGMIFLLPAMLLLIPVMATSQTSYGLEESIEAAMENNADLQQQLLTLESTRRSMEKSWNIFLPSISLSAGGSYSDSLLSDTNYNAGVSLSGSASLSLDFSTSASLQMEILNYSLSMLGTESVRDDLAYSVQDAFYQVVLAASQLAVLEDDLSLVEDELEQTRIQFQNGYVDESTYLQSQLDVASARLSLSQGESEYRLLSINLQNTLGIALSQDVEFSGEIDADIVSLPDVEALLSYIDQRLDVQQAEVNLELAEYSLVSAKAARLPGFSISGSYSLSPGFLSTSDTSDSLSLGLTMSLPVDDWIPGSSTDLAILAAEDDVKSLQIALDAVRSSAEYEIRSLVAQIELAATQIEIANLQLEIAEQAYALSEEGFASGTVEQLELETSRTDLLEARMSLLDSEYTYAVGVMDLVAALNIDSISELLVME